MARLISALAARAARRGSLRHIRLVSAVPPRAATGLTSRVYRQVEDDFGMLAPPIVLHAPAPEVLAASWAVLRESLLSAGHTTRPAREAVAAAVSRANACPYCVDIHSSTLHGLLRTGDGHEDPVLRALAAWSGVGLDEELSAVVPPFSGAAGAELVAVAVTFHYLNRMVNVFLTESPVPPAPAAVQATVRRVMARLMGSMAAVAPPAGTSAGLLPDAPLPPDLAWTGDVPHVAAAFAQATAAIDRAGDRSVPAAVREAVHAILHRPAGPDRGAGAGVAAPGWLADAVARLPVTDRAAGRLALLTVFASFRVTDSLVAQCRAEGFDDRALIELTSWAAMTAARHAGRRLARTLPSGPRPA